MTNALFELPLVFIDAVACVLLLTFREVDVVKAVEVVVGSSLGSLMLLSVLEALGAGATGLEEVPGHSESKAGLV